MRSESHKTAFSKEPCATPAPTRVSATPAPALAPPLGPAMGSPVAAPTTASNSAPEPGAPQHRNPRPQLLCARHPASPSTRHSVCPGSWQERQTTNRQRTKRNPCPKSSKTPSSVENDCRATFTPRFQIGNIPGKVIKNRPKCGRKFLFVKRAALPLRPHARGCAQKPRRCASLVGSVAARERARCGVISDQGSVRTYRSHGTATTWPRRLELKGP